MAYKFQEMEISKVLVSTDWSPVERGAVGALLQGQIDAIDAEETELRRAIQWEAPCFKELAGYRGRIDELLQILESSNSAFLEVNRRNYSPYVVSTDEVGS